jgi:hypothetical protein
MLNQKGAYNKTPYLINMQDPTDRVSHKNECNALDKKLSTYFSGFDNDLEMALRSLIITSEPSLRGNIN